MWLFSDVELKTKVAENGQPARFEIFPTNKLNADNNFLFLGTREKIIEIVQKCKEKTGIIIFDAHIGTLPGVHDSFLRRISELIPFHKIILVGTREFNLAEHAFLKETKIKSFSMNAIHESVANSCDALMENANRWEQGHIMISLDVLDPAFAKVEKPATGGMTTRELIYFVQRLRCLRNYHSASIVDFEENLAIAEKVLSELAITNPKLI